MAAEKKENETGWKFYWSESHSMISAESWTAKFLSKREMPGNDLQNVLTVVSDRMVTQYYRDEEVPAACRLGEVFLDAEYFSSFIKNSEKARKTFFSVYEKKERTDLHGASNEELLALFDEYLSAYVEICRFFQASQHWYTLAAEKKLKALLMENGESEEEANRNFSILTLPREFDLIKKEEIDFLELASNESANEENFLSHAKKHAWLFFNTYDSEDVRRFLHSKWRSNRKTGEEAKKILEHLKKEREGIVRKQEEILSNLKNRGEAERLMPVFQRLATDRLELKGVWSGAEFLFSVFFNEVARRFSVSTENLMWAYCAEDFRKLISEGAKLSAAEVEKRKKIYLFLLRDGKLRFFSGEVAEEMARMEVSFGKKQTEITEFKGITANPGRAVGRVRLVFLRDLKMLANDLAAFQQGEIMVTPMTQPTMTLIVKKAAAIVADEGGITSHAAMIAREFGKPCIVGAHIATQVLKTGDLIEVDATKGVVRKISGADAKP